MARLGTRLGGQAATFYGLSGFGDLVVTCEGKWSRNRTLGEELTRGRSAEEVLKGRKTVAEGHAAAAAFAAVCARERIEAPILAEIHAVLYAGKDPRRAIPALMERELKEEGG
jgi:glycerol-3-phosphate dehydrogenase (NAD(P)+)